MFFSRDKIERFCRTLITGMVEEVATNNKEKLEEYWDRRITTLTNLEKELKKNIDGKLSVLQANVDRAVEKLTELSAQLVTATQPATDAALSASKENDKKRTELLATQAKESNSWRDKTAEHMALMEELQSKQLVAYERLADAAELLAKVAPHVEIVLDNLAGAIDDIKKPAKPVIKLKKKKD